MAEHPQHVAVVTGATGGIGTAIVHRLVVGGAVVIAHYASNSDRASKLQREVGELGGTCSMVQADLRTEEGVGQLVDSVDDLLRSQPTHALHALVNNAAKLLGPSFSDATPAQFDEYFALNVKAPFFLTQRLVTRMHPGGSIVNVSSAGAHFSSPGDIVYAMSKAAIESLTMNAAEWLATRAIRINTVIPGFTDNGHSAFRIDEVREYLSTFAVLGGISDPETVAEAVAFLLSAHASRTTGATLDVSGGSTLGARPAPHLSLRAMAANRSIDQPGTGGNQGAERSDEDSIVYEQDAGRALTIWPARPAPHQGSPDPQ
ncbi:SDR family oxidoreductase [Arthrobacter bambusae]|jgi:NAD(P)-dependent dehydrogenase (short-subunit alcohol dehydrogenase family)|uniref:SDR family NAD(P)-dependent oxidoreductase n=1 Tax=Arthrobacter TaxID=1663 RepID=UPI001F50B16E|nr:MULTISPECIES: SDR family oxidoreductase [Arthrobacter]MCI0143948.1 SDR family oxidoreductase [Arthrobacter bambusae]UYY81261.1 SDR family oxidoreductase [Arthrobacter sp. YA7-1]